MFRKLFRAGPMVRLPKQKRDMEVFLALAASVLDPRMDYDEPTLNLQLAEWMAGFSNPDRFDHVTVRRYLVDYALLLRDDAGASYRTNQTVISSFLTAEARSVQPQLLFEAAEADRQRRRRAART